MLDALRKQAGGLVAKVLIGLLVISFAIWGVSDMFGGVSNNVVAQVGSATVSTTDYQSRYQQEVQAFSQQIQRAITLAEAQSLGIPTTVLAQMVNQALLDDQAGKLGLALSDDGVAQAIARDPTFQIDGQFSTAMFQQVMRSTGFTERQIVEIIREQELRAQISEAVASGVTTPDALERALQEYRGEQRTIRYITLTPAVLGEQVEPTEADIAGYYASNAATWQAPETRDFVVVEANPEVLADRAAVTEEAALAYYNRNLGNYSTPEQRHVWQFIFPSSARADEVQAMLSAGRSYDDLVAASEITPTDLGTLAASDLFDPAIAAAAFALEPEGTTIAAGRSGRVLVHVDEVVAGVTIPFDIIRQTVIESAALEAAERRVTELYNEIEDARSGGATLAEAATQFGLPVRTVEDIDAEGFSGGVSVTLPGGVELLAAVFESDVGLADPPIDLDRFSQVWFEVTDITPARQQTLEEVRDLVIAGWRQQDSRDRLQRLAQELVDRLDAGETLDAIAAERGLTVAASTFTRTTPRPDGLSTSVVATAFIGPEGTPGFSESDGGTFVVSQVETVALQIEALIDQTIIDQLTSEWANDIIQAYVLDLQQRTPIRLNQTAIDLALGVVQ